MVTAEDTAADPKSRRTPTPDPDKPESRSGMGPQGSKFTIRGDVITDATSKMDPRDREALRWIAGHCKNTNQSHRDVAPLLKQENGQSYAPDSLYAALTGRRANSQVRPIVEAIERYRRTIEERGQTVKSGFIETAIYRKIRALCRKALRRQRMVSIYGNSQIGKTRSVEEYAEKFNHGETHLWRCSVGGGFGQFLRDAAASLHIPQYSGERALREAIIGAVDEFMLLIVDELHEPFGPKGDNVLGVKIVNFLRELYDRKKCGVVLIGTNVFRDAMHGHFKRNLAQTLKRSLPPLNLPNVPPQRDLVRFAEAFGLPPAPDQEVGVRVAYVGDDGEEHTQLLKQNPRVLQDTTVKIDGLGRWITILEEAADLAVEKRRPITWGMVLHAWDSFEKAGQFDEGGAA